MPALLLTLVAGHVADRLHRGRIIAACILAQAVVALLLVSATQGWGGDGAWVSRELLLWVSVVLGLTRAFQMPALQALTPTLLPASCADAGELASVKRAVIAPLVIVVQSRDMYVRLMARLLSHRSHQRPRCLSPCFFR